MPRQKQQYRIYDVLKATAAALKVESLPNPTEEQKQQIHQAKVDAARILEHSNLMTVGELADENIETNHQVETVLEAAGIDPVQMRRQHALAIAAEQTMLPEQQQTPQFPEPNEDIEL